jgi:hypothetical protein
MDAGRVGCYGVGVTDRRAHLDKIRPLANAWHSTPEGLEWHRQHGNPNLNNRPETTQTCNRPGCGNDYTTTQPEQARYCSANCSRMVREKEHAYDIRVNCPACGIEFWQNKYKHTPTTCSRICGQKMRRQTQER